MVLSTALFDKPAFRNLVCNGLVLADDGKKMSKRLKNYPVRAHWPGSRNVHVSPLQHAYAPSQKLIVSSQQCTICRLCEPALSSTAVCGNAGCGQRSLSVLAGVVRF